MVLLIDYSKISWNGNLNIKKNLFRVYMSVNRQRSSRLQLADTQNNNKTRKPF